MEVSKEKKNVLPNGGVVKMCEVKQGFVCGNWLGTK